MDLSSFTVVIRTPDQKFQDINIQLSSSDCTIKELKKKIECDHPGSPKATLQKLIYDGKMLVDHHKINSVIKESNRVVHLVYRYDESRKERKNDTAEPAPTVPAPELRNRISSSAPVSTAQAYGMQNFHATAYSQAYANWLQQYQQQCMQYYAGQSPYYAMGAVAQPPPAENDAHAANNQAAAQDGAEQRNVDRALVIADDNGQDWLEVLFGLTRFMLLMSIVYFYSTTYRFVLTICVFFIIYLYQAGVFQVDRRPGRAQNANRPDGPPATDDNNNNDSETNDEDASETELAPPPPPGIFATAFCFVCTFFSSLVPADPPAGVN